MASGYTSGVTNGSFTVRFHWTSSYNAATNQSTITVMPQVYNTGNGIRNSEKDRIFDRFYRSDESRSKSTGGYGLGLSIAKAITDAHGGTITVDSEEGRWISFTVVL